MITKKTKNALKALIYLANSKSDKPVQVSEIAEAENISLKFLEQIMIDLRKQGIIRSVQGKMGGYYLSRPATSISLLQVFRAMEGPIAPVPCLSATQNYACEDCRDVQTCSVRLIMENVYESMLSSMLKTTLATVIVPDEERSVTGLAMEPSLSKYELDSTGFLKDYKSWDKDFAKLLAPSLKIQCDLTEKHWDVIRYIRTFYETTNRCPLVYQICRANNISFREFKGLFPTGYLRGACRLAGLSYKTSYVPFSSMYSYAEIGDGKSEDLSSTFYVMDGYGYLIDPSSWTESFAILRASEMKIDDGLQKDHWKVIKYLRTEYENKRRIPTVFETCEALEMDIDELEKLFPDGYNRSILKIAGLHPLGGMC